MIFKKAIWIFFAFFIGLAAMNVTPTYAANGYFSNAVEAEGSDCAVAGGDMIAAKSFSICKEDLAYNVLYMAFAKIFNEFDILKVFVFENAGSLDQEGYAANMGGAILSIILGITQVVFIAGAIVLGAATVKVMYNSMTSGQFLGAGVNKVWIILRSLLVIFLIFPVGSVSLAQLGVLMMAMFAIMGGNFFYGLFLSQLQQEALLADDTYVENQQNAVSQSDAMIQGALCQNRTIKAVRDKNFKKYEDKWLTDLNFNDQISRLANCIAPEVYYSYPATTFSANPIKQGNVESIKISKKISCEGILGTTALSEYNPEYHGYAFNCGVISFSNPQLAQEVSTGKGQADSDSWFSSSVPAISNYIESQYSNYALAAKLEQYYSNASGIKTGSEFSYESLDGVVNAVAANMEQGGLALYNSVKAASDHNTAVKALYVANSILLNNLLGGKSPSSENVFGAGSLVVGSAGVLGAGVVGVQELQKTLNDRYAMKENDSFKILEKYSVNAASALDESHCLKNFFNVVEPTLASITSLTQDVPTDFEDFLTKKNSSYSGECLWFTSASELNPRYNALSGKSPAIEVGGNAMLITMGSSGNLAKDYNGQNKQAIATAQNTNIPKLMLEAQANKMALASHFYVARSAVKKAMLNILSEATDKEMPKKMRKQGFASFGGYILQISSDQTNVNKYIKRINTGVTWSSYTEEGGEGLYVDTDAFGKVDLSVEENKIKFLPMILKDFFAAGSSTNRVTAGAASGGNAGMEDDDSGLLKDILHNIEDSLTAPMIYLKKMGGLDQSLSLRLGVEKCFKQGNCYPGDIHPVNALSYMGIDLMDTSIKFYMVKVAINGIAAVVNFADEDGGSAKKNSGMASFVNKFASWIPGSKLVKGAIWVANAGVNVLAPIFGILFLLGIFFGYMIPMLPYVAFLIMFLGWVVYIFELLITVPIWLVMLAIPGPSGQPRGNVGLLWQYTGLLLLKPSLMVIGMIFGWYFAVLSIFFINMTLFGVMGPMFEANDSYSIMDVVDVVMFYCVYLIVVFVALKHSFAIISSFPATVAEAIELKGYGDKRSIQEVGAEQLLSLMIINQGKQAVDSAVRTAGDKIMEGAGMGREKQLNDRQVNAARQEAANRTEQFLSKQQERDQAGGSPTPDGGSRMSSSGGAPDTPKGDGEKPKKGDDS